ncbi:MAG TPA: transglycosylase domain-containing protein, partial [Candidatus Polarisedimenticolaceae bacterium]|nr:transglycosylase domain-containing protein [Candidatus Polarisedimenticolaceae bacterium]
MRPGWRRVARRGLAACGLGALALAWSTCASLHELPATLAPARDAARRPPLFDRRGEPLSVSYEDRFNLHDVAKLEELPPLLVAAFLEAEDRRFHRHHGVDWRARAGALLQNLRAGQAVRGASTITEQVVRMLHPRPRSLWARWLEGWEAGRLERRCSKREILEFYLNQVPYAARRRGVVQAARYWFDRPPDTLSATEQLALAVLVRSPSRLDPRRPNPQLAAAIERLAARLSVAVRPLELRAAPPPVEASHFVRRVRELGSGATTLDASLQRRVQALLDGQLARLEPLGARHGAVLVVDHRTDEVLAWVDAGGSQIDAVLARRQPGSTLKPFLYAGALARGWTAATLVEDAPLTEPVGTGLHAYRNYSRRHYGRLRLREALGNSLNVPAVHAVEFVGPAAFHADLRRFGFSGLDRPASFYGKGLALGNGEVSLLELVQGYAMLARGGIWAPLRLLRDEPSAQPPRRVLDEDVASLIGDILSDPEARRLEFGVGGLLELPVQTAVKTGTSSDYRDAWALGYSSRYTVGVWIGNLDRGEMQGVSGSIGP